MIPDYSIIIPHKNTPELLNRLLNTIPEDDCIQVVVVDDNSNPSLKPLSFRKNVEVILLDANQSKGAGKARNVGIERAVGKWLLFADSDDFFVENFLFTLNRYKDSESEVIIFKADSVDSESLTPSNRNIGLNRKIDECINGRITPLEMSLSVQQPWCRMINKEFIFKNNILFDEVIASNDTMFTTKLSCMATSIAVSSDVIYVVTFRTGSLWHSRKKPDNYICRIKVNINRAAYLKDKGLYFSPLLILFFNLGYVDLMTNLKALGLIIDNNLLFSNLFSFCKRVIKNKLGLKY